MVNTKTKLQLPLSLKLKKRFGLVIEKKKIVFGLLFIGIILATVISFLLPKLYRATGKIYFKYNSVNSSFLNNNGSLDSEFKLLQSADLLKYTVNNLAKKGISVSVNDIVDYQEIITDEAGTAIDISIVSDEANKSAEIINALTEAFSETCLLENRSGYISTLRSITEREESLQEDIKRVLASQQSNQISSLNLQHEQIITEISEFESELESIELESYLFSSQLKGLQKVLEDRYSAVSANILMHNDSYLNEVKVQLERLETQNNLSSVTQKLGNFPITFPWAENYDLKTIAVVKNRFNTQLEKLIENLTKDRELNNLKFLKDLSKAVFENQIKVNAIDLTKSTIFNTLTVLEEKFNQIPFSIIDIARQARTKKFNSALAIKIKAKILRLKGRENEFFAEVESLRNAEIPKNYFSPSITLNIFWGALIGLLAGMIIAAGSSDSLKIDIVKSTEDLEESGYKIISQIPSFPSGSPLLFDSLNMNDKKQLDSQILNSFGNIETFLKYGSLERSLKTVLITSGYDDEGKSLIASNVAIALANNGNKVLLVDVDLIKPQLNKYFKIKSTPSLAHYLFRKKELDEIVRSTHNKNLDLITCIEFPQNPAVIITSERMKNFMTQVESNYDYIVYDSSSLSSLRETADLAKNIDEVLLVVRANKTKITEIINAESILNEYGVSDFNVVLNDTEV
jgi:capsular exopolysaccharide synthesis family protein